MFWITVRDDFSQLPNACGPIEGLEKAEEFASKIVSPGSYKILDGEGKLISVVTISVPAAQVQRTQ